MNTSRSKKKFNGPSRARKWAFPLLALCAVTILILFGVHVLIEKSIDGTIRSHAEMDAAHWAKKFNAYLPRDGSILDNGQLNDQQIDVIDSALKFGNIYAFLLYDRDGQLVYSSDHGVTEPGSTPVVDTIAHSVAKTGIAQVESLGRVSRSGSNVLFLHSYVPLTGDTDVPIGAIMLFQDKSETANFYAKFLGWFGLLLPVICALVYIIPALAFIFKREQAFAKTKHVYELSRFDTLTGALNRQTMSSDSRAHFDDREVSKDIGVFFIDVDKFKNINDANGHEFGDAYLRHVATVLINSVRKTDLVGRMGGDEFVVVMPGASLEQLDRIGTTILEEVRKPFEYKGKTVLGSLSIGSHLAAPDEDAPSALHAADLALYHAKTNGRDTMKSYFKELDTAMIRHREVEARIREALHENAFEVNFQPLTCPQTNKVLGFEALLRLNSAQGEPISPVEFIPIAEETGLIHEIGTFVLRQSIITAKSWPEHVFVSVNLSPAQFKQGNLVEHIGDILKEFDFPASRLEFEVTEGLLMADEQQVSDQLVGLKQMGISIAMDDFGTGYSSLGYLWKYNFDKLKIDRVFLEGFDFDPKRYSQIIETIVILGHQMGMTVTVEGVETEHHHEMLGQLGCDQYQGFYFGKPMNSDQALELITKPKGTDASGTS